MSITGFLFAVLGSNLFWIGYAVTSVVAAATIIRIMPNQAIYDWIMLPEEEYKVKHNDTAASNGVGIVLMLLFWPIVAFAYLISTIFKGLFGSAIGVLPMIFRFVFKAVPKVEISFDKPKDKE